MVPPTKKLHFIVIDDSKLDCFIAEKVIKNTGKCETVQSFLAAKEALEYIRTAPVQEPHPRDSPDAKRRSQTVVTAL